MHDPVGPAHPPIAAPSIPFPSSSSILPIPIHCPLPLIPLPSSPSSVIHCPHILSDLSPSVIPVLCPQPLQLQQACSAPFRTMTMPFQAPPLAPPVLRPLRITTLNAEITVPILPTDPVLDLNLRILQPWLYRPATPADMSVPTQATSAPTQACLSNPSHVRSNPSCVCSNPGMSAPTQAMSAQLSGSSSAARSLAHGCYSSPLLHQERQFPFRS